MSHPAKVIRSLEELLETVGITTKEAWDEAYKNCSRGVMSYEQVKRHYTKIWKAHVNKHGNVPMIRKCRICSGREHKDDIKHGVWKVSTREEQKALKEELEET